MTFWPKKSTREETPVPVPSAGSAPSGQPAPGMPAAPSTQDSSRIRNFLGKGNNSGGGNTSNGSLNGGISSAPTGPPLGSGSYPSLAPIRQVFGVTIEQAIEQGIVQPGYMLPAVVYRCIEYLNAHKAKLEEGIYRLSGSTAVIKSLKERFNHDGDFPLLAEEDYYDIHAVAGLLKLFLRELPSSVLTRELHKDFLQVIGTCSLLVLFFQSSLFFVIYIFSSTAFIYLPFFSFSFSHAWPLQPFTLLLHIRVLLLLLCCYCCYHCLCIVPAFFIHDMACFCHS